MVIRADSLLDSKRCTGILFYDKMVVLSIKPLPCGAHQLEIIGTSFDKDLIHLLYVSNIAVKTNFMHNFDTMMHNATNMYHSPPG